ncbi:MAG: hypothetical protein HQL97_09085 [Magnetococcales bacterium]|nr:hypothetical protein [Magnetococcales bacterium]
MRRWLIWLLFLSSLGGMYGSTFVDNWERSRNPYIFEGDMRVFNPYYQRVRDPELFKGFYELEYNYGLANSGYRALFESVARFTDPVGFAKTWPFVGLIGVLVVLGMAAVRLVGLSGAWGVVALALSSGFLFQSMAGGNPRSFAYPLTALAIYALVAGRIYILAGVVVLGALFYVMMGLLYGVCMATVLLLLPERDRGDAVSWSLQRRMVFMIGVGALCAAFLLPQLRDFHVHYGQGFALEACDTIPEIGMRGRIGSESACAPQMPLFEQILQQSVHAIRLTYGATPWSVTLHEWGRFSLKNRVGGLSRDELLVVMLWMFSGIMTLIRAIRARESALRRLLALLAISCLAHEAAIALLPNLYFPNRYLYPIGPLFLLFIVVAAHEFAQRVANRLPMFRAAWSAPGCILGVTGICLLLLGSSGSPHAGLKVDRQQYAPLYQFVETLPKDARIAGWPKGILEDLPLLARRANFVSHEHHSAFHLKYIQEMRHRTFALVDAYFATTLAPLIHLRDGYGVTHLLLEKPLFEKGTLRHFSPFIERAEANREAGRAAGFEAMRQIPHAGVFDFDRYVILDLARLREPG